MLLRPATASCGVHFVAAVPLELAGIPFTRSMYCLCETIQSELAALPEASGQRIHARREVFNGLRYVVKTDAP